MTEYQDPGGGLARGWYHDPAGTGLLRYWDGGRWTDLTGDPDAERRRRRRRQRISGLAYGLLALLVLAAGAIAVWYLAVRVEP